MQEVRSGIVTDTTFDPLIAEDEDDDAELGECFISALAKDVVHHPEGDDAGILTMAVKFVANNSHHDLKLHELQENVHLFVPAGYGFPMYDGALDKKRCDHWVQLDKENRKSQRSRRATAPATPATVLDSNGSNPSTTPPTVSFVQQSDPSDGVAQPGSQRYGLDDVGISQGALTHGYGHLNRLPSQGPELPSSGFYSDSGFALDGIFYQGGQQYHDQSSLPPMTYADWDFGHETVPGFEGEQDSQQAYGNVDALLTTQEQAVNDFSMANTQPIGSGQLAQPQSIDSSDMKWPGIEPSSGLSPAFQEFLRQDRRYW